MGEVIHLYNPNPQRGDRVQRAARCIGTCGWDGYLIRTIGEDKCPTCPRCGYWTEAITAPRSVMRRFQHDHWPR